MMPPLTANELTSLQAEAQSAMTDTCLVQRVTKTNDGMGHERETWNTIHTTVGRMGVPSGGYIAALAQELSEVASWVVSLPFGTDVLVNDQVVIKGQTLKVQAVYSPETYTTVVRVLASELR